MSDLDRRIHLWFEGSLDPAAEEALASEIDVDASAASRFVELSDLESGLAEVLGRTRQTREDIGTSTRRIVMQARRRRFAAGRTSKAPWAWLGIAAVLLLGLAALLASRPSPKPAASPPEPVAKQAQPPPPSAPPDPRAAEVEPAPPPPPTPLPAPPAPVPAPVPPAEPPPVAPKAEPPPSTPRPAPPVIVAAPKAVAVPLADITGTLLVRGARAQGTIDVLSADELAAAPRRGTGFSAGPGLRVRLERDAALRLDARDDGTIRAHVLRGIVFFESSRPLQIGSRHAQAVIASAAFQVDVDDRRTQFVVVEGAARLLTEKGEVTLKAGQTSQARAGERPSAPSRGDVQALCSWRLRPELSPNPGREAYVELEPGANRRLAGLVIAAPYADAEAASEAVARAAAERLDVPLVVARHYRAPDRNRWINVDRGMESDVRPDGTVGEPRFSERARKSTSDYLDHLRAAAGAGRGPVPFTAQVRIHYEKDLELGEAAFSGFPKAALYQVKALYPALLDKHKPPVRFDLKFQGVDDAYEWRGEKRRFLHTEEDPRLEGTMAPRNARNAATFFFPEAVGASPESLAAYGRILADLLEALHARRRG